MNYIDLLNNINKNKVNSINLIDSSEIYLLDMAIEELKDFAGRDFLDFNYEKYDYANLTKEDYMKSIETLPVMASYRLIFVDGMVLDKDRVKKFEDKLGFIIDSFENFNPSTILFLINRDGKIFTGGKLYKKLTAYADLYDIGRLDKKDLINFIGKYFTRKSKQIDKLTAEYIGDSLGYLDKDSNKNLYDVENELDKLLNNMESERLSLDFVKENLEKSQSEIIFALTDALGQRNLKRALRVYKNIDVEDKASIFYMLIRFIRNLICIKDCVNSRIKVETAANYCDIKTFEYNKTSAFVRNFSFEKLLSLHKIAYEGELALKTSNKSLETIVENLIFQFCME